MGDTFRSTYKRWSIADIQFNEKAFKREYLVVWSHFAINVSYIKIDETESSCIVSKHIATTEDDCDTTYCDVIDKPCELVTELPEFSSEAAEIVEYIENVQISNPQQVIVWLAGKYENVAVGYANE